MVKVSVIVPVYNVEKYLEKCIDSIIEQSLTDIEIILIDDGSTDSSGKICDEYKEKDARIKVIHKENEGLGLTRNSGLKVATGQYIGFVDSDDYIGKDMYLNLYNSSSNGEVDIVYGGFYKFIDNKIICKHKLVDKQMCFVGKSQITTFLFDLVATPSKEKKDSLYGATVWKGIFKKEIIDKYNLKFVSERVLISEDIIWDVDYIPKCNNIVVTENCDYYYRTNLNSLTTIYKKDRFNLNKKLYLELKIRLTELEYSQQYIQRLPRYFLTILRISVLQEVTFMRQNGFKSTLKNIKNICSDKLVIETLNEYNYFDMEKKQAMFFDLIKRQKYFFAFCLAYINVKLKAVKK